MQPQVRSRMLVARPRPRPQADRVKLEASAAKAPAYLPPGEPAVETNGASCPSQEGIGGVRAHAETEPQATSLYDRRDLLAVAELARHYLFSGDLSLAQVLFEGLTATAPEELYFALGLALTYDRMGQRKEADAEYQRAEKLDPSDARPDVNRAELLLEGGDRVQARALLARGVQKAKRQKNDDLERKASALLARIDGKNGR